MNIQIFGTKKSFDSKKAERFFKERNIRYQFIDLKEKGMTWAELARRSNLSKATTTRIKKNTDHRGHPFQPTYNVVLKVSIGLGIGIKGYLRLFEAAFPQSRELETLLKCGNVTKAEIYLAEKGLPLLGEK